MSSRDYDGIKLPKRIREELGISDGNVKSRRSNGPVSGGRKAQRKDERARRKESRRPASNVRRTSNLQQDPGSKYHISLANENGRRTLSEKKIPHLKKKSGHDERSPSKLRTFHHKESGSKSEALPPRRGKAFVQDDAEIEALEKALGLKDKNSYPKVFEEEGLDSLLSGLEEFTNEESSIIGKRKRGHDIARQEVDIARRKQPLQPTGDTSPDESDFGSFEDAEDELESLEESLNEDLSEDTADSESEKVTTKSVKQREDPYRPPTARTGESPRDKYVPPSLRQSNPEATPDLLRLRRQLQGQLNRLSESNMLSIAGEVEKISKDISRQSFYASLRDMIIERLLDRSTLSETFVILLAGFTAALCRIMGPELAVLIITEVDAKLSALLSEQEQNSTSKESLNLMAFVAQLYIFQIISARLIFDYIRLCINEISETNTELLLRMIRITGNQIRLDDASAIRDIVETLQAKVELKDATTMSVRTKFMIETIQDLKTNKSKHGTTAASIASEHTTGMKKTLGTLNSRTLRMTEPLGIGLEDIRNSEKKGRWWLVGASYQDPRHRDEIAGQDQKARKAPNPVEVDDNDDAFNDFNNLALLARENRMNTDVRRSIFIAIMSSTDCNDAYTRLKKLSLRRSQELEIPKVIVRCAASEKAFNPFYAALLSRVCTDRKLKMAIQFSIWDLFKQMGETNDDHSDSDSESEEKTSSLSLREVVNLARTFGTVIANGTQTLGFLKVLNLTYLQQHTRIFLEVLLTTMILQTQQGLAKERNEAKLLRPFLESKDMADMASSVLYFIREVLGKSDIAGSSAERRTVKWACRVAGDALSELSRTKQ